MSKFKKHLHKIMVMMALALASLGLIAGSTINAPKANASAFWVSVSDKSYSSVNIYNKAGCLGATNHIYPGQQSSTSHIWKTIWVPPHSRMHFLHYSSGYSYYVDNPHSYRTCHAIGKYFDPIGIFVRVEHNS